MNLTQKEIDEPESCQAREGWGSTCSKIKAARKGMYPPGWWAKVKLSGMMKRIVARWGSDDEIHIRTYR